MYFLSLHGIVHAALLIPACGTIHVGLFILTAGTVHPPPILCPVRSPCRTTPRQLPSVKAAEDAEAQATAVRHHVQAARLHLEESEATALE
jgi:hypothetical protein